MSDNDRLLATTSRSLEDGCTACNMSKVYCRCVTWIEGPASACCDNCTH